MARQALIEADNILADEILSHQINLFRFTAGERSKILGVFVQMQKELKAKLQTDLTDFGRARVNKLLKECTATIEGYYKGMNKSIDLEGLAINEAKAAVSAINRIGLNAAIPSKATLSAMVSDTLLSGAPLKDWWAKQSDAIAFKFAAQVRQGVAQGESLQEIVNRIMGDVKKGIPGVMAMSRRDATALVHDSVMKIANDAKLAVYRENADILKGVEQLSTLDSKTSVTCIAYSGAAWDLDGQPINGTTLPFDGGCPRHVNCRSVLVPITKTYRELGLDVNEKGAGTRSSDLGQVKASMTFDAFLKRHDVDYQDALLGKGKAQLWRTGKITLTDLLGQNGRELTLLELAGTIAPVAMAAVSKTVIAPAVEVVYNLLTITDCSAEFVAKVKTALDAIPERFHEVVAKRGYSVKIGGSLTEVLPELKGVHPRGWPRGSTWDNVGALHSSAPREIIVGEKRRMLGSRVFSLNPRVEAGTAHEFGHALDNSFLYDKGNKVTWTDEFQKAYRADVRAIRAKHNSMLEADLGYFLQKKDAGKEETFAEMFARLHGHKRQGQGYDLLDSFPQVAAYMKQLLGL